MMSPAELQAFCSFIDEVEEADVAMRVGGTVEYHHNGGVFLIELKAFDITGLDDEL